MYQRQQRAIFVVFLQLWLNHGHHETYFAAQIVYVMLKYSDVNENDRVIFCIFT